MWHIKEEDLEEFKITCRNRLSPEGAVGFMLGTIIYDSLVMFFLFGGLIVFGLDYYPSTVEKVIVIAEVILYSLQVFLLVVYLFPKVPFKFPKLQTLVVLLYAFQLGTIGFTALALPGLERYYVNSTTLIYIGLLLLGAIFVHIAVTIDTFKQASEGAFNGRNDERVSFFSDFKMNVIKGSFVYTFVLLVTLYFQNDYTLDIMGFYFILTVIMYAVAVGAAEFQLLAYCRFKFPSFNMSWEEHEKRRKRFVKKNKNR